MKHTCYVIDDQSVAIEALVNFIEKTPGLELLGTSLNPLEALEKIRTGIKPDITFLDIDMPELSGLDVADMLKDQTAIIFTTAHSDYAVAGFDKNIADFLLKPISYPRFLKAVTKVTKHLQEEKTGEGAVNDTFFINPGGKGKMLRLKYSDVYYIEGGKNYVDIHTPENRHTPYLTMKEVEDAFPSSIFFRVHKSYIVNIEKIRLMEGGKILLENDVQIPLGTAYKERFMKQLGSRFLQTKRKPGGGGEL